VYGKEAEGTELYIGQLYNNGILEFGVIGEEHYFADLTFTESQVFDEDIIIVHGLCGAGCAKNYLLQKQSGIIEQFFIIYGGLQIVDLNGDGINELLGQTGSPIAELMTFTYITKIRAKCISPCGFDGNTVRSC